MTRARCSSGGNWLPPKNPYHLLFPEKLGPGVGAWRPGDSWRPRGTWEAWAKAWTWIEARELIIRRVQDGLVVRLALKVVNWLNSSIKDLPVAGQSEQIHSACKPSCFTLAVEGLVGAWANWLGPRNLVTNHSARKPKWTSQLFYNTDTGTKTHSKPTGHKSRPGAGSCHRFIGPTLHTSDHSHRFHELS